MSRAPRATRAQSYDTSAAAAADPSPTGLQGTAQQFADAAGTMLSDFRAGRAAGYQTAEQARSRAAEVADLIGDESPPRAKKAKAAKKGDPPWRRYPKKK